MSQGKKYQKCLVASGKWCWKLLYWWFGPANPKMALGHPKHKNLALKFCKPFFYTKRHYFSPRQHKWEIMGHPIVGSWYIIPVKERDRILKFFPLEVEIYFIYIPYNKKEFKWVDWWTHLKWKKRSSLKFDIFIIKQT